jgi:hypothetical protein
MAILYQPVRIVDKDYKNWDRVKAILDGNFQQLQQIDEEAKKAGKLVGRYIRESVADGLAYYQIIKEGKRTVRIRICLDICGDNYRVSYWGEEATIDRKYALKSVEGRDMMTKMFEGK